MKAKHPQTATSEKRNNLITFPTVIKGFVFEKLYDLSNSIHEFYATILHKFLLIYLHIKASCVLAQTKYVAVLRQDNYKLFSAKHCGKHCFRQ